MSHSVPSDTLDRNARRNVTARITLRVIKPPVNAIALPGIWATCATKFAQMDSMDKIARASVACRRMLPKSVTILRARWNVRLVILGLRVSTRAERGGTAKVVRTSAIAGMAESVPM